MLFVEPCSLGQVPVAIVYQPTPVLGGKPCCIPFAPFTPARIRAAAVGMAPSAAYLSTRSGRMPSELNISTLELSAAALAVVVEPATVASTIATAPTSSPAAARMVDLRFMLALLPPCR